MKRGAETTHLSPCSLWTETAAWFKLYPFTSVHAAYSDSCRVVGPINFADKHLALLMRLIKGDSWKGI